MFSKQNTYVFTLVLSHVQDAIEGLVVNGVQLA